MAEASRSAKIHSRPPVVQIDRSPFSLTEAEKKSFLTDTQRLIAGFSTRVNRVIDCSVNGKAPNANGDWAIQSGSSYGRSLDWIDRTVLAACRLDTSITKTSLAARLANSATSLKQAVLGHLRGF